MPAGGRAKLHYGVPFELHMTRDRPPSVKKVPTGLSAPLYGMLPFGPADLHRVHAVLLDAPKSKDWRLWVDANADGDLTNDAPADWKKSDFPDEHGKRTTSYWGGAMLVVPASNGSTRLHVGMYPHESQGGLSIWYYADYLLEGSLEVAGASYPAMLFNVACTGDYRRSKVPGAPPSTALLVDLNGDGQISSIAEIFDAAKPFNIQGSTYELRIADALATTAKLVRSEKSVDAIPVPPDLREGKQAVPFRAMTTDGRTVDFPRDYKGKLVLLDFWATWCGPCRREIPNVVTAYGAYHGLGFEVLGISLDKENMAAKLASFAQQNGMAWPQVYDGKWWKASVAQSYGIDSIPRGILVDGSTGLIVRTYATDGELLGGIQHYLVERGKLKRATPR